MNRRNFFGSLVGAALAGSFVESFNKLSSQELTYYDWWSRYSDGEVYFIGREGYIMNYQSEGVTKLTFREKGSVEIDFTDCQGEDYKVHLHEPPRWAKNLKWAKTKNLARFKEFINTKG